MQLVMPKHLYASEGKIYPKSESCIRNYTPKVVQYKHTIRVITPFQCSHGEEINKMSEVEQELNEKKKEIEELKQELKLKDQQILMKDEEIQKLKQSSNRQFSKTLMTNSIMINKLQKSQVTDIFQSNVKSIFQDGCLNNLSNIKSSFVFELPGNQQMQSNVSIVKIEEQFSNIQNTLNQLQSALSKPKKKYEFFNKKLRNQKIPQLPQFTQRLAITQIIQDKRQLLSSHLIQNQQENDNHQLDQSIDHTSTNQSVDTNDFLQEAISQHNMLKEALIELQKSTKIKMDSMRQFYENQLLYYKRMLQLQNRNKCKNSSNQVEKEHLRLYNQVKLEFKGILNSEKTKIIDINRILDND